MMMTLDKPTNQTLHGTADVGCFWFLLLMVLGFACNAQRADNYNEMIKEARALMKEDKLPEAKAKAEEAAKLDPKRYEAFAITALIAVKQGDTMVGKDAVAKALQFAPAEKKASLEALQKKLAEAGSESRSASAATPEPSSKPAAGTNQLTGEARRKYDALLLIIEEADKAPTPGQRQNLLREYLEKSDSFVLANPTLPSLWLLRAAAAVELGRAHTGWEAGGRLKALGAGAEDDPKVRRVLAMLERKGWLGERDPEMALREQAEAERRRREEEVKRQQEKVGKGIEALAEAKSAAALKINETLDRNARLVGHTAVGKWRVDRVTDQGLYHNSSGFIEITEDGSGHLACQGSIYVKRDSIKLTAKIDSMISPIVSVTERQDYLHQIAEAEQRFVIDDIASTFAAFAGKAPVVAELHGQFTWKAGGERENSSWAMLSLPNNSEDRMTIFLTIGDDPENTQRYYAGTVKSGQDWRERVPLMKTRQ
jgi:hypothetical protein